MNDNFKIIETEYGVFRTYNKPEQITNGSLNFDEEMIYFETYFSSNSELPSYCLFYGDIYIEDFDVFRKYYIKEKGSNKSILISPYEYNIFKNDSEKASQVLKSENSLVLQK